MERPVVLVNGTFELGPRPWLKLYVRYAERIAETGGLALVLPPLADREHLAAALDAADGVLLTGGDDFHTEPLGLGPTHAAAVPTPIAKQEFDLALARLALERRLPVLGICYGMQCLGLGAGARLLQQLPEDRPGCQKHRDSAVHAVSLGRAGIGPLERYGFPRHGHLRRVTGRLGPSCERRGATPDGGQRVHEFRRSAAAQRAELHRADVADQGVVRVDRAERFEVR